MIFQFSTCMIEQFVSISVSSTVFTRDYNPCHSLEAGHGTSSLFSLKSRNQNIPKFYFFKTKDALFFPNDFFFSILHSCTSTWKEEYFVLIPSFQLPLTTLIWCLADNVFFLQLWPFEHLYPCFPNKPCWKHIGAISDIVGCQLAWHRKKEICVNNCAAIK